MTPKEFKAWFEGFTEAMDGMPSEAQWAKIKARVAEIDGTPVNYPVYVDRYWPRPKPWWDYVPHHKPYWDYSASGYSTPLGKEQVTLSCRATDNGGVGQINFESMRAMYAAGKADFEDFVS
jgi:hypothetical protein